jgi:hypothetical protein
MIIIAFKIFHKSVKGIILFSSKGQGVACKKGRPFGLTTKGGYRSGTRSSMPDGVFRPEGLKIKKSLLELQKYFEA